MKRAHVSAMTRLCFVLAAILVAALTVGCTSTGTTGGGDGNSPKGSRGGGWENFRAEMPVTPGSLKVALAILIVGAVAACSGLPKDGRYQTGGGGWDNFRAEAPTSSIGRLS